MINDSISLEIKKPNARKSTITIWNERKNLIEHSSQPVTLSCTRKKLFLLFLNEPVLLITLQRLACLVKEIMISCIHFTDVFQQNRHGAARKGSFLYSCLCVQPVKWVFVFLPRKDMFIFFKYLNILINLIISPFVLVCTLVIILQFAKYTIK